MRTRYFLVSTAMAVLSLPMAAMAQSTDVGAETAPVTADTEVQEIVVTAFGRAQKLRDVPVSVLAISGNDLQQQALVSPQALAIRQPGFRISPSPASDYIFIRGVGSSANPGFEQSVGTFVDGLYRGRSRDSRMALFDLERVEILRGPQTTFFGNNTIAGALNLISRKPGDQFAANASAYYSPDFGEYVFEGGLDLPVNDRLSVRLSARQSGSDGYITNVRTGDKGPRENDGIVRAALAWQATENIKVDARIDAGRMRDKDVFNIELTQCPPPANFGAAAGPCGRYLSAQSGSVDSQVDYSSGANPSSFDYDFVEAAWMTTIDLGANQLTLKTGWFDRDYGLLNDPVPIPAQQGGSAIGMDAGLPIHLNEGFNQFSQELRFTTPKEAPLSFIGGVYFQKAELQASLHQGMYFAAMAGATGGLLPARTPVAAFINVEEESKTLSAFGALTWRLNERFRTNLGLRHTSVRKTNDRSAVIGSAASDPQVNFVAFTPSIQAVLSKVVGVDLLAYDDPSRTDRKLMVAVSAQHDFTPGTTGYLSYSQGFKAGGFSILTTRATFRPETVDAYEIGLKGGVLNNRVTYSLAAFDSRYSDLQESTSVLQGGTTVSVVTNAARSVVQGIEVNAKLKASANLTLETNLTHMSSKYADYSNGPCTTLQQAASAACVQDLSGKDRAMAPKWSGNLSVRYRKSIGDDIRLSMEATPYFSSSYFVLANADERMMQDAFTKLDARIGLEKGNWELALIGRNLTDVLTASYQQIVPGSAGAIGVLPDAPRSIGLQLNVRY